MSTSLAHWLVFVLLVIGTMRARPSQQMEQAPSAPAPPPVQHQTLQQQQNGTETRHSSKYNGKGRALCHRVQQSA